MLLQYADDDSRINHRGDFDVAQIVCDTKALDYLPFERCACASRMDKRAVDVEKKKSLVHFNFSISDSDCNSSCDQTERTPKI
jgi:hypothetical protein